MFTPRPVGTTLRRLEQFVARPHDPAERMDPEFPIAMRCEGCGKLAFGPRKLMQEAIREHKRSECPARKANPDPVTRIFYPRS
jgi:hypothetical protein